MDAKRLAKQIVEIVLTQWASRGNRIALEELRKRNPWLANHVQYMREWKVRQFYSIGISTKPDGANLFNIGDIS